MKSQFLVFNFLLSVALFCASFYLAWQLSALTNFLYSAWYEVIELDAVITKYAPNNKVKKGFENTNKRQHVELFSGIVEGIQHDGKGLKKLSYTNSETKESSTLLTKAELVHLQDVANLVAKFKYLAILSFIIAVFVFLIMRIKKIAIAKFKSHLLGGIGSVIALTILIVIVGPTKIFYLGHELIFPNNHQWFFYYEESLMSTMMKAPVLFGPIACQLIIVTIIIWALAISVLQKTQESDHR